MHHTGKTNIYVTTVVEATLDLSNDYLVKQRFGVTPTWESNLEPPTQKAVL